VTASLAAQPLDTLSRPVHDLRISVTDRCNLRCTYCMPAEVYGERYQFLPRNDLLRYDEIARITRLMASMGVRKVRVTGGEPLVRRDVPELIAMLSVIDGIEDLTLTTNGLLLRDHAEALREAGLGRVTVSLDSLNPEVFGRMNGKGYRPEQVLGGIAGASAAGLGPIKINAVVERGVNDHTVVEMARHFKGTGHIVRFIEFMDVGNLNGWDEARVVPSAELIERIDAAMPIEPLAANYAGEVAECSRARLSADGSIYTCLFASEGVDLRGPIRSGASDEELGAILHDVWTLRADRYSELRTQSQAHGGRRKIEMYQIGG
jgi:cyclic pyranopterin phosphate synthase